MKYFEFNRHDYYALIAVEIPKVPVTTCILNKAYKVYLENVGGESLYELKNEGTPTEITKKQALLKFLKCKDNEDVPVGKLFKEFEECRDHVLLIDGGLL